MNRPVDRDPYRTAAEVPPDPPEVESTWTAWNESYTSDRQFKRTMRNIKIAAAFSILGGLMQLVSIIGRHWHGIVEFFTTCH